MKLSRSEKKGTMCVQTMIRKRKTTKFILKTRGSAGSQGIRELHIVDKIEPATSSTLGEDIISAMSKPVKEMVPLCFSYFVDFKNSAREHKLGVGEDPSGKANFFQASHSHKLRGARKDCNAECAMFGSNNMKDMVIVSNTLRTREQMVTCSAPLYKLSSGTGLLLPNKRKSGQVPRKVMGMPGIRARQGRVKSSIQRFR